MGLKLEYKYCNTLTLSLHINLLKHLHFVCQYNSGTVPSSDLIKMVLVVLLFFWTIVPSGMMNNHGNKILFFQPGEAD